MKCRAVASAAVLLAVLVCTPHAWAGQSNKDQAFTERIKQATALLYSQDESGGLRMHCTATAFEKTEDVYQFVTAAHCIGEDDPEKEKVAAFHNTSFYITFDESGIKTFHRAKVHSVGYQHRGDDFAVFEVESDEKWPTTPIGDEQLEEEGNEVLNVASPLGLGLQVFHGSISKLKLDRPVVQGDINWKDSMLLQMPGTDGGSSGSSIISPKQEAIIAFLVGTIGNTTITAIPVSRFKTFLQMTLDGKYRWARTVIE
jgi:S1-C subfamily serine protease